MGNFKDIRELIIDDWRDRPRTREVQGLPLGDVPAKNIMDIIESGGAKPPNRDEITTGPKEGK